jgi:hypothetical protein
LEHIGLPYLNKYQLSKVVSPVLLANGSLISTAVTNKEAHPSL